MSKKCFYRLSMAMFGVAVCLLLPACRTLEEDNQVSASCEADRATIKKLKRITMPEMTFFYPATLVDALEFIEKASRDYDLPEKSLDKRGVSVRLRLNPASPEVEYAAKNDPFLVVTNAAPPRIAALSVYDISLYDALQLVCEATEMCWHLEHGDIVVEPNEETDTRLVTRSYHVPYVLQRYISEKSSEKVPGDDTSKTWKALFAQLKMTSPNFKEFTFLSSINKLRVTGTPRNLKILETVLDQFAERMVEAEMQIHAFRAMDIEQLRLSGGVSVESLMALRQKGKGKQVASSTVLTKSGEEAIMKALQEVTYPMELLTEVNVSPSGTNLTEQSSASTLMPSNIAKRKTGMILQVVPEIRDDNVQAHLTLKSKWITLDHWESCLSGIWGCCRPLKQPVFGVTSAETQVVVNDGETLLVGSCSTPDGEWVQAGFLTVRLKPVQPRYVVERPVKVDPQEVQRNEAVIKMMKEIGEQDKFWRPSFTIIDALRFFKEASIKVDESDSCEKKRGVNFVLKLQGDWWNQMGGKTNEDRFAATDSALNEVPEPPALVCHYLSLYDQLKLVCDVTGLKFSIRDGIVWIVPSSQGEEMITRIYSPLFVSIDPVNVEDAVRVNYEGNDKGRDWKKWFEELGVPWPSGSSISFLPAFDLLRVANTHENHQILEQAGKDSSLFYHMVEVDMQIHAFRPDDIEKLGSANEMSVEALMALRKKGKAKPIASATVVTKSGQEAIMKAVQEVISPTEVLRPGDEAESSDDMEGSPQTLIPGSFITQETGMTLQVVPEVDTEKSQVNVTIRPTWVTLEGWRSIPVERVSGPGTKKLSLRQPVFRVTKFETQALIKEGGTVLIGNSSTPDGKWIYVGFLTVK